MRGRSAGFYAMRRGLITPHAIAQKLHRRRVAQAMRGDMLALERRTALDRQGGVLLDDSLDRVTAETAILVAHEQWPVGRVGPFVEPSAEYRCRIRPERCRTILAPLAVAPDVGTRTENDIAAAEADQLGYQTGQNTANRPPFNNRLKDQPQRGKVLPAINLAGG